MRVAGARLAQFAHTGDWIMRKTFAWIFFSSLLLALGACGEMSKLSPEASLGPEPTIPEATRTLIPTVLIAPAKGWPEGEKPTAAPGMEVSAFATGLDHPRWVYVLPNGDVLVAESAGPPRESKGIKAWFMKRAMGSVGSAVPSADRITLLRDADGDGKPETRTAFLEGLKSPF